MPGLQASGPLSAGESSTTQVPGVMYGSRLTRRDIELLVATACDGTSPEETVLSTTRLGTTLRAATLPELVSKVVLQPGDPSVLDDLEVRTSRSDGTRSVLVRADADSVTYVTTSVDPAVARGKAVQLGQVLAQARGRAGRPRFDKRRGLTTGALVGLVLGSTAWLLALPLLPTALLATGLLLVGAAGGFGLGSRAWRRSRTRIVVHENSDRPAVEDRWSRDELLSLLGVLVGLAGVVVAATGIVVQHADSRGATSGTGRPVSVSSR